MFKSKKAIILIPVIAVLLLLGMTAGIVLAQDGPGPNQDILAKVAKILGIDQQKLAAAFKQAQTELQAERLAQQVKDGKITQQQADQLKAWEAKRPADPKANPQQFQDWMKSRPDIPFPKPPGPPPDRTQMLDKLVKDGKITQAQADQLKAWEAKRPADPKADPQKFQDWMKSRPDVPLPRPDFPPGPGFRPGFHPPPR
jgi:polyhydroxyalkanoate synthesis regulator phasin